MLGASNLAKHTKISPIVIGLTLISVGNSMPELYITIQSSIKNIPDLAIGTLIGSNIAHISLVTGIAAIIQPFKINKALQNNDILIFFITSFIATLLLWDNQLTKLKSILLIILFILSFSWIIFKEIFILRKGKQADHFYLNYVTDNKSKKNNIFICILWIVFSAITLHISSNILIESAQKISNYLGIANLAVGLFLLGIGTNLPELAILITSMYNNERDLALGSILGANIVVITLAVGIAGIICPNKLPDIFSVRDLTSMMIITTVFSLLLLSKKKMITRSYGLMLITLYSMYILLSIMTS